MALSGERHSDCWTPVVARAVYCIRRVKLSRTRRQWDSIFLLLPLNIAMNEDLLTW
jgi:hypothetical protein